MGGGGGGGGGHKSLYLNAICNTSKNNYSFYNEKL